jgi:hypothetical protein
MAAIKSKVDWDALEPHYRAGIRTFKDLGAEFGVSDAGIIKHAKRYGWTRNLKGKIQALAEKKVSELEVSEGVSVEGKLTEFERVEFDSTQIAKIHFRERKDLIVLRDRFRRLAEEFGFLCDSQDDLTKLGELLKNDEASSDKLNAAYQRVISFDGRVDSGKKLVETTRMLYDMEAKVFKLNDDKQGGLTTLADALREIDKQ